MMAGYFGAGLAGSLQGYNQALANQPVQMQRVLALRGEMQRQAILNQQLQDQSQAEQALPSLLAGMGQPSNTYFGSQTPAPGQPSVPLQSPGASQSGVQPVGPNGVAPYLPMSSHVAAAAQAPSVPSIPDQLPQQDVYGRINSLPISPGAKSMLIKQMSPILATQATQEYRNAVLRSSNQFKELEAKLKEYQLKGPKSTLGKLKSDLESGAVTQDEYNAAFKKATHVPITMASIYLGGMGAGGPAIGAGGPSGTKGTGTIYGMTPDAIDLAATVYRKTGKLTSTGFGVLGQMQKAAIMNRAAVQAKSLGQDSNAVFLGQQATKASTLALNGITKQRSLVLAFEDTALKNADQVLQASSQVDRTGSPAINRWLLAGRKNIAGDPAVARLDLTMRAFINEYARVTSSVTGGGVTSDTARREIESAINSAQTPQQVEAVISQARTEMENRRQGYDDQISELRGQISGTSHPSAVSAPQPVSTQTSLPPGIPAGSKLVGKSPQGVEVYESPDGKRWTQ